MSAGKILIVDDSEESRELLSEILTAEGYDVRPADSGELALAAVAVSPPELILLDMRMPGMGGIEVCKQLKSRPETRDIPVIFLSASLDFEDRLEGLESGAVDFVNKPFRREELLARLKTHLELSRLRRNWNTVWRSGQWQLQAANDQLKNELERRRKDRRGTARKRAALPLFGGYRPGDNLHGRPGRAGHLREPVGLDIHREDRWNSSREPAIWTWFIRKMCPARSRRLPPLQGATGPISLNTATEDSTGNTGGWPKPEILASYMANLPATSA